MKTDDELLAAYRAGMGSSQTAALRAVFELGCKDVKDEAAKAVSAGEITYTAPAPVRPKVKKPAAKRRK